MSVPLAEHPRILDGGNMVYGLMIVTYQQKLSESERRLFRKRKHQIFKRTDLKQIKNGVYLLPFEKKTVISEKEFETYDEFEDLMKDFEVKTNYFWVTEAEPKIIGTTPSKSGKSSIEGYFLLKPIKKKFVPSL